MSEWSWVRCVEGLLKDYKQSGWWHWRRDVAKFYICINVYVCVEHLHKHTHRHTHTHTHRHSYERATKLGHVFMHGLICCYRIRAHPSVCIRRLRRRQLQSYSQFICYCSYLLKIHSLLAFACLDPVVFSITSCRCWHDDATIWISNILVVRDATLKKQEISIQLPFGQAYCLVIHHMYNFI